MFALFKCCCANHTNEANIYVIDGNSEDTIVIGTTELDILLLPMPQSIHFISQSFDVINDMKRIHQYCDEHFKRKKNGEYSIKEISKDTLRIHMLNLGKLM
jgi:hypothetical protein